jgi:motility quorum-sensing regulator/GCU-specific mRNA interferase toxin
MKRKPTYDIEAVKAVFSTVEKLNVTGSALRGAASLGFGRSEIVATIQTIERRHFYKSMTSFADHRVWQDVYPVPSEQGTLLCQIHGRSRDRVLASVIQGKGR